MYNASANLRWQNLVILCAVVACGGESNVAGNGSGGSGGVSAPRAQGDVPCAVATVIEARCARCHGDPLPVGIPVRLVTAADFQAARGAITVGAAALIRAQDPARPMPPPPDPRLSADELGTLRAWIDAGAVADPSGCAVVTPVSTAGGAGGTGGASGQQATGGSGGAAGGAAGTGSGGSGGVGTAGAGGTGGAGGAGGGSTSSGAWSMFGRDLGNSRNNPDETTISPANVAGLHEVWRYTGASTTSTPAVVDGVVYLPTWDGAVRALRADDGSEVWTAALPDLIDSSAAVTADTVYVSDDAGSLHALRRADGTVKWSRRVDTHPEAHLWSSPIVIEEAGLVVVGVASGEEDVGVPNPRTFRGSVVAVETATGTIKWQVYTTENDATSGPGIAVWATPTVDTTRKLLYVGTGNAYAAPAGPYTDAMLAIDYETGMLQWHTQFTPGDVFVVGNFGMGPDYDIGSTANLFSAGGKDLLGIGVKNGVYYALDRDSGGVVWMQMLTPGGALGGVISASAYANGTVYVASNRFMEGTTRTVALDAATGTVRWDHDAQEITYGGVAHANGVVYVGVTSGTLFALDAATGAELWTQMMPAAIAGSPTVAEGKLFVPWGYTWTLRQGPAGTGGMIVYAP